MVTAYYKVFMTTMISGGINLNIISTIRYWYWDGYYKRLQEEYRAAVLREITNTDASIEEITEVIQSADPMPDPVWTGGGGVNFVQQPEL